MNKREKLFVLAYTDTTCPKTYENATQSALKSGYSDRNARSQGCKMLKKPTLAQQIHEIQRVYKENSKATRGKKIQMAWINFLAAKPPKEKEFWWKEHGLLSGDYITKTESTTEVKYNQDANTGKEIISHINRLNDQINTN